MSYHLFIKPKSKTEWIDIGPVSDFYEDTREGVIKELNKRQAEVAKKVSKHYKIFVNYELDYHIGDNIPTDC